MKLMLVSYKRLFDNQVEQLVFEDQMREMFTVTFAFFSSFCVLSSEMNERRTRTKSSPTLKSSLSY